MVTPDLATSVAAYSQGFGWDPDARSDVVARERAARWSAPFLEGARTPSVRPARLGGIRLVEASGSPAAGPLTTFGWVAAEVCVRDLERALEAALAAGWRLLHGPGRLAGGSLPLVAAQVAGPSGEAVYLTQVLDNVPGFELPRAVSEVDGVFIAVLGARDVETPRLAIERAFSVRRASDRRGAIGVLNAVHRLPMGTSHRLSTLQLVGRSCLEIDQLPAGSTARVNVAGAVPAGITAVQVMGDVQDARVHELPGTGGALLEVLPRRHR